MHESAALKHYLGSFAGYCELKDSLAKKDQCEPKMPRFPHAPVLCSRWWKEEHQKMCGCVTEDAVRRAIEIDNAYGQKIEPKNAIRAWFDRVRKACTLG
jgi:hypothetical protein